MVLPYLGRRFPPERMMLPVSEELELRVPRWRELQQASRDVRSNAWAPYSKFQVGAAVLTGSGTIFRGCNVENASYGLTICAERVAICSALASGERDFPVLCVSLQGMAVPCGACRQFLVEFNARMVILLDDLSGENGAPELTALAQLLPRAFRL
jgi:cytidine deaminase